MIRQINKALTRLQQRLNNNQEQVVVVKSGVPSYHRLHRLDGNGGLDEVVLTMPGLVVESDLPPILSSLK